MSVQGTGYQMINLLYNRTLHCVSSYCNISLYLSMPRIYKVDQKSNHRNQNFLHSKVFNFHYIFMVWYFVQPRDNFTLLPSLY